MRGSCVFIFLLLRLGASIAQVDPSYSIPADWYEVECVAGLNSLDDMVITTEEEFYDLYLPNKDNDDCRGYELTPIDFDQYSLIGVRGMLDGCPGYYEAVPRLSLDANATYLLEVDIYYNSCCRMAKVPYYVFVKVPKIPANSKVKSELNLVCSNNENPPNVRKVLTGDSLLLPMKVQYEEIPELNCLEYKRFVTKAFRSEKDIESLKKIARKSGECEQALSYLEEFNVGEYTLIAQPVPAKNCESAVYELSVLEQYANFLVFVEYSAIAPCGNNQSGNWKWLKIPAVNSTIPIYGRIKYPKQQSSE